MAEVAQSPEAPRRFGKYWLDAQLAEGGMSRVLRARLRGPGGFEKKLVVKQILPRLAQDPGFIELFVREANTLVQMSHPNIVPVYELGVVDGVYFLAMELVDGATVAELLRDGPLPEAMCAHIGSQIAEALHYAHERFGLVHRDVTPRNIIIDAGGHVRLLDFGIAAPLTHSGASELFGSPGYMSPEQIGGQAVSAQSDLFSLGTVLYEALLGERAIPEPQHAASPTPALPAGHAVSAELAAVVDELLALEPTARPKSAALVAARLRTWLAQRHPEGVAGALGQRAEQARARAQLATERPPQQLTAEPAPPGAVTRSIATSKQLSQLIHEGTEPLARKSSQPQAAPQPVQARPSRARWTLAPLLAGALVATVILLQRQSARVASGRVATTAHAAAKPVVAPDALVATEPRPVEPPAPVPAVPPADKATLPQAPASAALGANAARARLSINALPWAELRLDGHPLGATPKRALAISPGAHLLQLDCPPLGRHAQVSLKLAPGDHQHVLVDLNTTPPQITQR
jgi:serine/threonine-protein kinase